METGALKPGAAAPGEKAAPGGSGRAFPKADGGKDPGEQAGSGLLYRAVERGFASQKAESGLCLCGRGGREAPHRSKRGEGRREADALFCGRQAFCVEEKE